MNSIRKTLKLILLDGSIQEVEATIFEEPPWEIALELGGNLFRSEGSDLMDSLWKLQYELGLMGIKLMVNGFRRNAVVSGMSRSMGGGRKAYLVEIGEPALRENLVDIFDFSNTDLAVSADEQRGFYNAWVESIGNRK